MTMASGHLLQLVLAVFVCLTGEAGRGISNISRQESSGSPHGAALSSLNGSVLMVLGGGSTVLLDRQRESEVNYTSVNNKKTLFVELGACHSRASWVSTGWASVTPLSQVTTNSSTSSSPSPSGKFLVPVSFGCLQPQPQNMAKFWCVVAQVGWR